MCSKQPYLAYIYSNWELNVRAAPKCAQAISACKLPFVFVLHLLLRIFCLNNGVAVWGLQKYFNVDEEVYIE